MFHRRKCFSVFLLLFASAVAVGGQISPQKYDPFERLGLDPSKATEADIEAAVVKAQSLNLSEEDLARVTEARNILLRRNSGDFNDAFRRETLSEPDPVLRLIRWLSRGPIYPGFSFLVYWETGLTAEQKEQFLAMKTGFPHIHLLTAFFLAEAVAPLYLKFLDNEETLEAHDFVRLNILNVWIKTMEARDYGYWLQFLKYARENLIRNDKIELSRFLSVSDLGTAMALMTIRVVTGKPERVFSLIEDTFLMANRMQVNWGYKKYGLLAHNLRKILAILGGPEAKISLIKKVGSGALCLATLPVSSVAKPFFFSDADFTKRSIGFSTFDVDNPLWPTPHID
jgi:hypothetical protein